MVASLVVASMAFRAEAQIVAAQHAARQFTPTVIRQLGFSGVKASAEGTDKWKLSNGVTVYSTYAYGKAVRGFMGPTPLFIAVSRKGKIISMAAAPNGETPEYFAKAKNLLKAWNGKTLKQAKTYTPDVVTGATLSSKAIIGTVHATAAKLARQR